MCNISAGFFRDGISEGIAKGEAKKEFEIIKTMLGDRHSVPEISKLLHLPVETVEKVQKSLTP